VRIDALDADGVVVFTVAAPLIEPELVVAHVDALRRAESVRLITGACDAIEVAGVVAVDADHRLALVRLTAAPSGVVPLEAAQSMPNPGDPVSCHAMLFAIECGFAAAALEPTTLLAVHALAHFSGHGHVVFGAPLRGAGSPILDQDGRLVGLAETGRDGTSNSIVFIDAVMAAERTEPMPLDEFRRVEPPPSVRAMQIAHEGSVARNDGDLRGAQTLVDRALALDAECWLAHYELGVIEDLRGRPDRATRALHRSIEIEPAFCESHYSLGLVHLRQGRAAEAIDHFRDAARLNPGHAVALGMLSLALEADGQLDAAFEAGEAALSLEPPDDGLYSNLATLYRRHGRVEDAIGVWRKRLERRPNDTAARSALGSELFDLERYPECAEALAPLLERGGDPVDLARLVVALWFAGDHAGSREALDAGLKRHPDHPALRNVQAALEREESRSGTPSRGVSEPDK
jgi:tetratricopeptide (TPR) repeat protein